MAKPTEQLISQLQSRLDRAAILVGEAIDPRYGDDLSGKPGERPEVVLRPRYTSDVAEILKACNAACQPLVIQGGRTGLSGGARVLAGEVVLSLERMTSLGEVETTASTIIAEAGVPLQAAQEKADAAGFVFGVDIGARGTATIGGNISTNAGGIRVLRYGNFRTQVLGVEAVLADGSVVSSLKGLAKDNTGYDLSHLFIGSEGTLGVVTRACLRLHPKPISQAVAFCALPSLEKAMALLQFLRARLGTLLSGFEIIFDPLMSEMTEALGLQAPVPLTTPVYVLTDIQGMSPETDETVFAEALGQAIEDGMVSDAVVSQSEREFQALWALRDDCNTYLFGLGPMLSLDVSLPLPRMGEFLARARTTQNSVDATARDYIFGHLGDGNLHYCVVTERPDAVAEAVFGCVAQAGGSISAEHCIGLNKKSYLHLSRSDAEITAMRRMKAALDPNNILNPGRIFDMSA
ncbi:FAD/FMN-containing dehydrogenase [Mesorhizobium soli]|uniref:FAD-binding oxidoreductase n=1 Tax=Pseudaminobacter soli (ex Li et al. 2025) TaxID=1295366 RepID=UPI0024736586|nr:FAD-binding oxidoreductase [Mesorhizobium soli]MDH6232314.1 FAD/FMN-containing dehydrogenase [Mesorhizobium soli]